ncbi:MAG TPA: hypothetical protein VL550_09950 [Rhodocyclaceae bacterium]|jgi:curved DNA-binding protein CbpA|nr:hypothetical protein [Rhodocyclaceae bacterium]
MNAPSDARREDPVHDLQLAQQWLDKLLAASASEILPRRWIEPVAALVALALNHDKKIQIVVPDDETLPELSNALDIDLRPLCLVLPEADFATRIALRATLTLLKSRLSRADVHPVWEAQHRRIAASTDIWQQAQQWSRSESSSAWPDGMAGLFPARLLPASQALAFAETSDLQILVAPERLPNDWRDALTGLATNTLLLSAAARGAEHRRLAVFDEAARRQGEIEMLVQEIAELELELATTQAEIADFSQRYHAAVGRLLVELDILQAEIARRSAAKKPNDAALKRVAAQSGAQAKRSQQEHQRFEDAHENSRAGNSKVPIEDRIFTPSRDLKKLYRQIAQKIHPDRAHSEADRDWRTQLMSEATRAYRNEDETALKEVLSLWQEGPGASLARSGSSDELNAQVLRLKARLAGIQVELDRLLSSKLHELFIATRVAERQGRDLLKEMAATLTLQIEAAQAKLHEVSE